MSMENGGESESFQKPIMEKPGIRTPQEIEEAIKSTPTKTRNPFAVLPKEIYMKIFNMLNCPTDKQNFMNAHMKWYNLFEAERVRFLFGRVFRDLPLEDEDKEDSLTDQHLLRLRLVCPEWDKSIQNYYQLHPDHFQFSLCKIGLQNDVEHLKIQYANGYFLDLISWRRKLKDMETEMKEIMASHPPLRNPFLTRKVYILIDDTSVFLSNDEQLQTFWSQLDSFFIKYGQHVWHFRFNVWFELMPKVYSKILQWLGLMPNLITLQMDFDYYDNNVAAFETNELRSFLQMEHPEMKKLQHLYVSNMPHFAFNKFLERMEAVEKVELNFSHLEGFGFKFPISLTELSLKPKRYEDLDELNALGQLPVLRTLIINLEKISVKFTKYVIGPSWQSVWNDIEGKFPDLEELHLSLPLISRYRDEDAKTGLKNKMNLLEQSLDSRLNLKKLKRLSLTFPTLSCLDFLQEIKTLQELKIHFDFVPKNGFDCLLLSAVRRERVQFNKDYGAMWESNIWVKFPNLRKLSVWIGMTYGIRKEVHLYEKGSNGKQTYNKSITTI